VKGLRREEIALLARVSIDSCVRMERGNLVGPSDAVLDGIVEAYEAMDEGRAIRSPVRVGSIRALT